MTTWIAELQSWWDALPPEWVLLMLLPFVVGAAGLMVQHAAQPEPERPPPAARPRRRRKATSQ